MWGHLGFYKASQDTQARSRVRDVGLKVSRFGVFETFLAFWALASTRLQRFESRVLRRRQIPTYSNRQFMMGGGVEALGRKALLVESWV